MDDLPDSAAAAGLEDGLDRESLVREARAIQRRYWQAKGLAVLQRRLATVDLAEIVARVDAAKRG